MVNKVQKSINKRLTTISKNESSFNRAKQYYQEALAKGDHKHDLKYNPGNEKKTKSKNTPYFRPPFCSSVETKIGKRFLEIISRNFNPMYPYHKIFNKKLLKISYSCMPNIKSKMSHNCKMLEDKVEERKQCNCRDKCMMDGNCLLTNVIYRAKVITSEKSKQYVGSSGLWFKSRYTRHKYSFNNSKYRLKITLSKYIRELNDRTKDFSINLGILARTKNKFNSKHGCTLCNMEKHEILKLNKNIALDKGKNFFK